MKLFISYSRDDKNYVYELAQALKDRSQHDVWIDRRLIAADLWWDTILDNIEACECFVALLTPKFVSSIYCNAELDYALSLQKPILPLMLKSCDMPAPLRKIQTPDISGTSLSDTLLLCTQALYEVRIRRMEGKYPAPERAAGRPSVPTPPPNSEHISDVYADAEEAAAEGNESLAEKLFNDVIVADPQGFGLVASERLGELRRERKRAQEYNSITRLIANPSTLKGARSAWKVYVQTFGTDYDPNGYADKLSVPSAPVAVPPSIVEAKPPVVQSPAPPVKKMDIHPAEFPAEKVLEPETLPLEPAVVTSTIADQPVVAPPPEAIAEEYNDLPPIAAVAPDKDGVHIQLGALPRRLIIIAVVIAIALMIGIIALSANRDHSPMTFPITFTDKNYFPVQSVAFSPDGKYVLTGSADGTAKLWDVQTGKVLQTFSGHTDVVLSVAFSPDGKYVLTGSYDNTAKLWDVQSGKLLQSFTEHHNYVRSVAFSPNGKEVLTGSADSTAKLWDAQSGTLLQTFIGSDGGVYGVAFSPDGTYVLTGGWDKTAKLWGVRGGKLLQTFTGHTYPVNSVVFSPNGKYVLAGSDDQRANLWEVESGKLLQTFSGHTDVVESVAFSPDGKYVLTGSKDQTAKLWDVQSGKVAQTFTGHTDVVNSVAFSPDGKYVLTGSADSTAKLWASGIGQ